MATIGILGILGLLSGSVSSLEPSAIHLAMNEVELAVYFGITEPEQATSAKYEVTLISKSSPTEVEKRSGGMMHDQEFNFEAFGKRHQLKMKRNNKLVAPSAKFVIKDDKRTISPRLSLMDEDDYEDWPTDGFGCEFYTGSGGGMSDCGDEGVRGFFIDPDNHFDVLPVNKRLAEMFNITEQHHVIVKNDIIRFDFGSPFDTDRRVVDTEPEVKKVQKRGGGLNKGGRRRTIETAVFLDPAAYKMFAQFYWNDESKIRNLVLAYMNGIQAMYHLPSLGEEVDFTIVRMELQKSNQFNAAGGERNDLLTNFCSYQGGKNPKDDSNPKHWDIGLLLSGLDFWALEHGRRSYVTMGLATVTGICTPMWGCVIGELGVRDQKNKPYPSTGFTSVYVMAHEIGHNLGMFHDGPPPNRCKKEGYIMSPSRGTLGETTWSSCSAKVLRDLDLDCLEENSGGVEPENDHNVFSNMPGQKMTARQQCQVLLRNDKADVYHKRGQDICQGLYCTIPGHNGEYYRSGPALEGTNCGGQNYICQGGACKYKKLADVPPPPKWSDWSDGPCENGCVKNGRGVQYRTRKCLSGDCPGVSAKKVLCDNAPPCSKGGLKTPVMFASNMCTKYKKTSTKLQAKITGEGIQAKHNVQRPDQACLVWCKKDPAVKDGRGKWYSPKAELTDFTDISAYFPEGTWCYKEGGSDYYCIDGKCTSPSTRGGRSDDEDGGIVLLQNSKPGQDEEVSKELEDFFTIDEEGNPIGGKPNIDDDVQFEQDDGLEKPE